MTIRQKIFVLGMVSMLGMAYTLWLQYKSYSAQVNSMEIIRQKDVAIDMLSLMVHELQKERGLTTITQARVGTQDIAAQIRNTDAVLAKLSSAGIDTKDIQQSLLMLRSKAMEKSDPLALRDSYTRLVQNLIENIGYLITKPGGESLGRNISAHINITLAKEYLGQIRATLGYWIEHGRRERLAHQDIAQLKLFYEGAVRKFRAEAAPDLLDMFDKQFSGQEMERLQQIVALAAVNASLPDELDVPAWWSMATLGVDRLQAVERKSMDLLRQKADAEVQKLGSSMKTGAIVTAVICLLIATLVISSAITILRSVNRVYSGIEKVIGSRDFQMRIPVDSKDEIGKISRGFNELLDMLDRLNHTQEERIEERTRELSISNENLKQEIAERKQAETKLLDARSQLAATIDAIPDLMFEVGLDGTYYEVHAQQPDLLAAPPGELLGKKVADVLPARATEAIMSALQEAYHHGRSHGRQFELPLSNGNFWFELSASRKAALPGDTAHLVVLSRDITDRKRYEQALQLHKSVIDISHVGFWIVDARGNLQMVNQAASNISGYSMEEMVHMHISQLEAIERRPEDVKAHMEKIIARGFDFFETRHIQKNGHKIDIEVTTSYLPDTQQFAAFIRDISDRKLAEEELSQTKTRYDYASEIGKVGTWDWHPVTGHLIWNDETFRILGLAPGSVTPTFELFLEVVHPDDREFLITSVQAALNERKSYTLDSRLITGNDEVTYCHIEGKVEFDPEGRPVRMLGTIQDITERKNAEQELRESEKRFRHLFESSPDPIWIIESHQFVDCNQAAVDMLGYPDKESLKNTHPSVLSPERQPDGEGSYSKAEKMMNIAQEKGLHRFEWVHTRKDGSNFFAEVTLSSITLQGRPVIHCLWRDITGSKQAQVDLQHKQDLLNEAQRLGQLGSWELDLVSGKLYWSDEAYRLFELDPLKFSPSYENFLNVIHPDDRDNVNQVYTRSLEDRQPYDIVHRLKMADGRIKWVREHCSTDFDASGKPLRSVGAVQDITEHKLAEDRLRVAAVAFDTDEAILITDAHSNIISVNKAFTRITGYRPEEVLGKNPRILSSGRMDMAFYAEMWKELLDTGRWSGEIWDRRKSGEIYPKWLTITAVKNEEDDITEFVAMFSDITARKKAEEEIRNLAFYDALTGLPNRRLLMDRFQLALSVSDRNLHYGAVLFLDMDKFKTLNDTLGHDHGDLMLLDVAKRIHSCVREADTVARLGGDEFVVLLEGIGITEEEASQKAAVIAEKIRHDLSEPYQLKEHEYHSSPSIGVCLFRGYKESIDNLLKHADVAMYQAKEAGRNTVRFFDPAMQQVVQLHAALERDLRHAVTDSQLLLYYQIQVDSDIKPIGAEALVRWMHPGRGMVSPAQFIPVAEDSTLILEIGQWVLNTACSQLASWSRYELTRNLELAINVSARQFGQVDFVQQVETVIRRHGIDPGCLKLELTESVVLKDVVEVVKKMHALKAMGVKLSLDDFGTGYSSLSYLKKLPLDQIKIDQGFVRDTTSDLNDAMMVKTIIDLAQNFQLNVIAEGVETAAQLAFLRESGCMAYQGYLFGKPMPVAEFEEIVRSLHEEDQG